MFHDFLQKWVMKSIILFILSKEVVFLKKILFFWSPFCKVFSISPKTNGKKSRFFVYFLARENTKNKICVTNAFSGVFALDESMKNWYLFFNFLLFYLQKNSHELLGHTLLLQSNVNKEWLLNKPLESQFRGIRASIRLCVKQRKQRMTAEQTFRKAVQRNTSLDQAMYKAT